MTALKHNYSPDHTYADYVQWEGRWELIYGIPYSMAPLPTVYHQMINSEILFLLKSAAQNCEKCAVLMPVDYKIGEDILLQPDVVVVCEPFEKGAFISKTPAMVFEILSPSTRKKDLNEKYEIYERQGVKYYVIVDPTEKFAYIYLLINGKYQLALKTKAETFEFDTEGCSLNLDFGKIW